MSESSLLEQSNELEILKELQSRKQAMKNEQKVKRERKMAIINALNSRKSKVKETSQSQGFYEKQAKKKLDSKINTVNEKLGVP